jgi:arylsulfatase A-like enzyme
MFWGQPSRTAFLTSRRPDTTKNYVIGAEYWRTTGGPNATSLPQHFKQSRFRTVGMGKIFHGAAFPWTPGRGLPFSSGAWDGNFSWSQESMPYYNFDNWSHYGDSISFGAFDVPDNNMQDGRFAELAVDWIEKFSSEQKAKTNEQPFFLGVGFHRPHIPYLAPQRYFDLYPNASDIPIAKHPRHPVNAPDVAYSVSKGIRVFKDAGAIHEDVERCYSDIEYAYSDKCVWVDGPRKLFAQNVKRAYFACISYVDAQVGKIVDVLKAEGLYENTVISFNGDHGYQLGEHGAWEKYTTWECVPSMQHAIRRALRVSAFDQWYTENSELRLCVRLLTETARGYR